MEKHLNTAELVAVTLFSASPIGAVRCFTFPPLKGGKSKNRPRVPAAPVFHFFAVLRLARKTENRPPMG